MLFPQSTFGELECSLFDYLSCILTVSCSSLPKETSWGHTLCQILLQDKRRLDCLLSCHRDFKRDESR